MENTYHCYANRELSWLRFNERVLEEAEDSRLPLCERLSFLSIFQSNLDEFFMVRIGSLQDQMLLDKNARENKTNMTSGEQIDAALAFIHKLTARRDAAYNGLLEQLAEQGIRLLDFAHMEEESRTELEKLFRQDYLPLLSSFIISKKQAFPFLKNKGIYQERYAPLFCLFWNFSGTGALALYPFPDSFLCVVCAEGFKSCKPFLSGSTAGDIFTCLYLIAGRLQA